MFCGTPDIRVDGVDVVALIWAVEEVNRRELAQSREADGGNAKAVLRAVTSPICWLPIPQVFTNFSPTHARLVFEIRERAEAQRINFSGHGKRIVPALGPVRSPTPVTLLENWSIA